MVFQLKKLLLVGAVVILFVLYAFQERPQSIAVDPKTLAALQTSTPIVRAPSPTATLSPSPTVLIPIQPTQDIGQSMPVTVEATETNPPPTATATTEPPTVTPIPTASGTYLDGTYTGSEEDAHWGYVMVVASVTNGMLTDIQIAEYPNHRNRSVEINDYALPALIEESIQAQSAEVDMVSGATDTSRAFIRSLDSALQQALA